MPPVPTLWLRHIRHWQHGNLGRQQQTDAEQRKGVKYAHTLHFIPETLGTMGTEALGFFKEVAHRIVRVSNEPRSFQYLLLRVAVAIQRGKTVSILGAAI